MYPDLSKICRICLKKGGRPIFTEKNSSNSLNYPLALPNNSSSDKIAEKLRFVLMLKINQNEILPALICDVCIMNLNISYNFKKMALQTDYNVRQYILEKGMNIMKDTNEMDMEIGENTTTTTALAIHQIVRTNCKYRAAPPEPIIHIPEPAPVLRGSPLFSSLPTSTSTLPGGVPRFNLIAPIPRPIQIKIEPIDDEIVVRTTIPETITTSPSASSGLAFSDVVRVNSSISSNSPPMVVINRENIYKTTSKVKLRTDHDKPKPQAIKTPFKAPNIKEKGSLPSDEDSSFLTTRSPRTREATKKKHVPKRSARLSNKVSITTNPIIKEKKVQKKDKKMSKNGKLRGRPPKKTKLHHQNPSPRRL